MEKKNEYQKWLELECRVNKMSIRMGAINERAEVMSTISHVPILNPQAIKARLTLLETELHTGVKDGTFNIYELKGQSELGQPYEYDISFISPHRLKASNKEIAFIMGKSYENGCEEAIDEVAEKLVDTKIILKIERIKEWTKKVNSSNKNIQQGGTISNYTLSINGIEEAKGFILEAAGADSKIKDTDQRISTGTYSLIKNPGTKGDFRLVQLTKELAKSKFGNRGKVNIHIGNFPKDVEGCFMPGEKYEYSDGYPKVTSSAVAYKKLKKLIINNSKVENIQSFDMQVSYTKNLYVDIKVIVVNNIK